MSALSDRPAPRLDSLQLGRALAALAVVAGHAALSSDAFTSESDSRLAELGSYGVDYFFVLSGFIIYYVHGSDQKNVNNAYIFMKKRINRVYFPYLPISISMIILYITLPTISQGNRGWGWFTSLTLLPTHSPPALAVAWTLLFEMTFYIIFSVSYYTNRFIVVISLWSSLTLIINALGFYSQITSPILSHVFNLLILEFVAGVLMSFLFLRLPTAFWPVPTLAGAMLSALYFIAPPTHHILFGLALAPLVLGLAQMETHYSLRLPGPILLLGSASYAMYLVHLPLQSLLARVLQSLDSWMLTFTACSVVGIVAGIAYHLLFERPLLRRLSRRTRARPAC